MIEGRESDANASLTVGSAWVAALRSSDDQGATFIELFFDLVFVYAVTQGASLVHDDATVSGVVHGLLVFWLIWWAWTQFTWALNPADTEHHAVQAAVLVATSVAFFMAYGVTDSYTDGQGLWFAVPYIAVRIVGLSLYLVVAWSDVAQRTSVRLFAALSLIGLVLAGVGGVVDTPTRTWLWLAALIADLAAGALAGNSEGWALKAGHFSERHGLFVIIALGESLIAVGIAANDPERTGSLVAVIVLTVAIIALLWWSYFSWIHDQLERALTSAHVSKHATLARDTYSFAHFLIVSGIIATAVGLEAAARHPSDAIEPADLTLVAGGVALFVIATAAALWRATAEVLTVRLVLVAATVLLVVWLRDVSAGWVLTILVAGLSAIVGHEVTRQRR